MIDQEPSQANRVEEALRDAHDQGQLEPPLFELLVQTKVGEIRLTSLDFPHRCADAYLRDSLVAGVRFDESPVGKRLRAATVADVRPLYEREPASLILGAWDCQPEPMSPCLQRWIGSMPPGDGSGPLATRPSDVRALCASQGLTVSRWPEDNARRPATCGGREVG